MRAKVLLLEEDATCAAELQRDLRAAGCDVTLLRDGNTGLARAVSERFDVILLSAELPGMNGFRVCNRIKKDDDARAVPLFLMSGPSADGFAEHQKLPTKAESYLRKPIVLGELLARLRMFVPALAGGEGAGPSERGIPIVAPTEVPPSIAREPAAAARRLADELTAAQHELEALAELRGRLAEQEQTTAKLMADLARARAAGVNAEALQREVQSLRRDLAEARKAAPLATPSGGGQAVTATAREILAQREALNKKEREALALRSELDSQKETLAEIKQKLEASESGARALEHTLREREAQSARAEKVLAAARADKEQAVRRAEEHARRADRSKPDLEQVRAQLEAEKERRSADNAAHARALDEVEILWTEERQASFDAAADAAATSERLHEAAIAGLRAEHDAIVQSVREELSKARETHAAELAATLENGAGRARNALAAAIADRESTHAEAATRFEHEARRARETADELLRANEELTRKVALAARDRELAERVRSAAESGKVQAERAFEQARVDRFAAQHAFRELQRELEGVRAGATRERARLEEAHARALLEARRELEAGRAAEIERAVASAILVAEQEARARVEAAIGEERTKSEAARADGTSELRSEIAQLREERAAALTDAHEALSCAKEAEAARDGEKQKYESALAALEDEHVRAVALARDEHESALARARSAEEAMAQAEQHHARDLGAFQAALDDCLAELSAERQGRQADAGAHARSLQEAMRATDRDRADALEGFRREQEEAHAQAIQVLERVQGERLAALRASFDEERARERSAHALALSDARKARAEAEGHLRADRQRAADERARMEKALEASKKQVAHADEVAAALEGCVGHLEGERDEALAAQASVRLELTAERRAREEDAARYQREREQQRVERDAQVAALREAIASARSEGDVAREASVREARAGEARAKAAAEEAVGALSAAEARFAAELEAARTLLEEAERRVAAVETDAFARGADEVAARHEAALNDARDQAAADLAARDRAHREAVSRLEHDRDAQLAKVLRDLESAEAARGGLTKLHDEELRRATAVVAKSASRVTELEESITSMRAEWAARDAARDREHESAMAAARRELTEAVRSRDARIASAQRELEEARRAHAAELASGVAAARDDALHRSDEDRARALAELETRMSDDLQGALSSARKEQDATLAAIRDEYDRARASLEARVGELSQALAQTRENLDAERRDRLVEEGETSTRMDATEALAAARAEEIERWRQRYEETQREIPELESEIVVLRSELMSLRSQLERSTQEAEAAVAQLDRDQRLLGRARAALAELVDRMASDETAGGKAGEGGSPS